MSSAPQRIFAGFTQDRPYQPLGNIGQANPFFYATMYDDFMFYQAGRYTLTNTSAGSIAGANGDGGQILFTTNATTPLATDISSQQTNFAGMTLDATKKMAFMCRIQLADATNPVVNVGKIQKTTTPFTVTDGIYFTKASGQTYPVLNVVSGSAVQASFSLNGIVAFANATWMDLAWYLNGRGGLDIYAASGSSLVGGNADQNRVSPVGPVGHLDLSALTLSAAPLAATMAIQSGTASSKTMLADFLYAAKER